MRPYATVVQKEWDVIVIGAGALGCVAAGLVADRAGRTLVTSAAMVVSGACCLLVGFTFEAGSTALSVNLPQVSPPQPQGAFRMGYLHENLPGVLAAKYQLLNRGGTLSYEPDTAKFADIGGMAAAIAVMTMIAMMTAIIIGIMEAARQVGQNVAWAERAPLAGRDTGKCLRFPNQGQFHPLKYLAEVARHAGP